MCLLLQAPQGLIGNDVLVGEERDLRSVVFYDMRNKEMHSSKLC